MTRVYLRQDGDIFTVDCKGHATGSPETCAAISCLMYTLAGWARNSDDAELLAAHLTDGDATVTFRGGKECETVLELLHVGFLQLAATTPSAVVVVPVKVS